MSMFLALVCEYTYLFCCLLLMKYLWQQKLDKKFWKYIIAAVTVFIILIVEEKWSMEEALIYPVEILCLLFLVKGDKFLVFMQFLMTDIMLGALLKVEIYITTLLNLTAYKYIKSREIEKLMIYILTLSVVILISKKYKTQFSYLKKLSWYHLGLCIAIEACLGLIIAQAELGMFFNGKKIANNITIGAILLVCLFIIIVIVFFIVVDINRKRYQEQNQLKDDYLRIQEKYYSTVAYKDEEVRKVKHDLKAHLGCIEILLEKKNYQEAEKYIKELKNDTVKRIDTSFKSGNIIIDAVLNDVAAVASKHGTQIILVGVLPHNIKIESPELCSLFYNLLSNCEESMKYYMGKLPKEIYVEISIYKRSVGIIVKNPVEKPVEISKLGKYTSKQDKICHGYGIKNIKTIVDKYKGLLEYKNQDGYFICKITFVNIIKC